MVSKRKYMWESTGWLGAVVTLLAFSLNSLNFISSQSVQYLGMQIFGCFLMALYGASKKAHASWILNAVFLLVALLVLVKVYMM